MRYDVIRARAVGLDPRRVEQLTGVPARSQRRIVREEIPFGMSDQKLHQTRRVGRPTKLAPLFPEIIDRLLAAEPTLKVAEVLRRLRSEHGYKAGKNPVYAYVGQRRPAAAAPLPVVRFEGVAGEFAQHDFGSLTVTYRDGTPGKLTFYAGRLKYSRALHVCLVHGETAEDFLRGLEGAAATWGGLPLFNVMDNIKAAVLRRERDRVSGTDRIHLNRHLASFLQEVGVFAEPTAPYSGQQKGSVENLIRFTKEGFLRARRFRNRADLVRQLGEWLRYVNTERPCDATGEIPAARLLVEQPRLRPLPFGSRGYGLQYAVVVGREARVRWGGCAYSTPARWIGQAVDLRAHAATIVLHYEGQSCVHRASRATAATPC